MTGSHPPNAARADELIAVTRFLDDDRRLSNRLAGDSFGWWRSGHGFVAFGVSRKVAVPDVDSVLARIEIDDEVRTPGSGAIAVGALGFAAGASPGLALDMTIPQMVLGTTGTGANWVTHIGRAPEVPSDAAARDPNVALTKLATATGTRREVVESPPANDLLRATHMTTDEVTTEEQWESVVAQVLERIRAGLVQKVVLARQMTASREERFSRAAVFANLVEQQPHCYVFSDGSLVGASPELLVERRGEVVSSRPMAGTRVGEEGDALRGLELSAKDNAEHTLVVEDVVSTLEVLCKGEIAVSARYPEVFGHLAHMVTDIRGSLVAPVPSALDLALALDPTPAVAGVPTYLALDLIAELEGGSRGRYAGPVGWVDHKGDGEFALALRCAELSDTRAVLSSGAGIVAGSNWRAEWEETAAKFQPMLDALASS